MTTKKLLWLIIISGIIGIHFSCKKNEVPDYSLPMITRVVQSPNFDTNITSGVFNEWLVLFGDHLASTTQVTVNGEMIPYNEMYTTDTSISLQIPRVIPANISNKIEVVTKGGTASYTFTVTVPPLKVDAILNEYTAVGDTLVVIGENFDLYKVNPESGSASFAGGVTAKIVSATPDTIKVIVPQGAAPGKILIAGDPLLGDIAKVETSGWYWDNRNFLFDMTNYTGWNGASFLSSGPIPAPINGPYFKMDKSWQGGWAWDPFCSNGCSIPLELVNDPAQYVNYEFKFEMNIPAGPPSLPVKLYMCFNSGDFKEYYYDPSPNGHLPFTTNGKWQTFSVPLKDWGNLDGFVFSPAMIMEFMLRDPNPSQSNFSICNFRLVPIQ